MLGHSKIRSARLRSNRRVLAALAGRLVDWFLAKEVVMTGIRETSMHRGLCRAF